MGNSSSNDSAPADDTYIIPSAPRSPSRAAWVAEHARRVKENAKASAGPRARTGAEWEDTTTRWYKTINKNKLQPRIEMLDPKNYEERYKNWRNNLHSSTFIF